jgi:hypothetical protein
MENQWIKMEKPSSFDISHKLSYIKACLMDGKTFMWAQGYMNRLWHNLLLDRVF